MYPALSARIPDGLLAAMPQLREKLHQGLPSSNPALYLGFNVCKSTTVLGLRAAEHLERVRSRYTGKERDTESGNDYFEARYFGSSMGRFLSPDGPFDGSSPDDPQSWNLYSYVQNNPLIGVDPDGHDCVLQTRTDANHETVSSTPGNCDNVSVKDGQSATYVNGNVTGWQAGSDGHSLDIGFNSYDGNSSGTQNAASAPYPDQPNLDMNWGNNSNAGVFVGAYKTVNYATIAVGVTFGSLGGAIAVTDALAGGGASLAGVGRSGASVANKLWHIFGNPDHGLGPLVQKFGGPAAAYEAIQKAAQSQISMTGAFKAVWIQVGGMNLQVNGTVIDGIVKISTAYVPH